MSEPAGPLVVSIHTDKIDLKLELRNPGEMKVSLDPFVQKFVTFIQNTAAARSAFAGATMSPDDISEHLRSTFERHEAPPAPAEGPAHPHGDGYHVPQLSLVEMLRQPCNKCLEDIAEAVRIEQERRAAEMS